MSGSGDAPQMSLASKVKEVATSFVVISTNPSYDGYDSDRSTDARLLTNSNVDDSDYESE